MKSEKMENYSDKSDEERDRERRGRRNDRMVRGSVGGAIERDRSPRNKKKTARVFVSNIPYEYRWQELKDLFREQVGEVSFVELFVDENDKPRGCGIVEFATPELANQAIEKMHRYDLKGRKLVVKEDSDAERDKFGRILPRAERNNMVGTNRGVEREERGGWGDIPSLFNGPRSESGSSTKWGNTYGLSTQFLESLNINGPLVPRVFVANLDYKVDERKMREVFRLAGRVLSAEISTDKEGKSRGFGVVEYEHPVEAVQAISMFNNQVLYERRLSVRMDRIGDKGDGFPAKLPDGLKGIGMGLGANGVPLQDVARNLPNPQNSPQTAAAATLTAAALSQLGAVSNLMGAAGPGPSDLGGLGTPFGVNPGPLGGSPSLAAAAQILNNTSGGNLGGFGGSSTGRDFDSLSAALSAGGPFNQSSGVDRGRSLGGGAGVSHRPNDSVIVKNLPPGTTWEMVRDKFSEVGPVKFAVMRGKDAALVQFANNWDAQRAVNMLDGIRVDGRTIDVHFF